LASLFDIGKSAVQAQRQALNVTGQNIANVNTDGYRKRSADLTEVSGTQSELTSITSQIGLGVNLGEVRRAYNVFLASSSNSSESRFQSSQTFVESMERLENAILPGEGDLSSQINEFFRTLSDVEASPGDLAPRAAAIEQGNGLANAFNVTAFVLRDLEAQISGAIDQEVDEVNRLVESLGSVNGKLRSSNLGASPPNALMDERDRLISEISQKVRITVNYSPRFDVNIRLGEYSTGPVLLDGETSYKIQPIHGDENGVSYKIGSSRVVKTLDDGGVKGLSTALSVIQDTHSQVDVLADRLVTELNAAHGNGIDYDGDFGRSMFTARQFEVAPDLNNSQDLDISVLTVPGRVDLVENATFRFNGRTGFWTAYGQNNDVMGTGRTQIDLDGVIVKVESSAQDGDSFRLTKADGEADRLSFLLTDGRQIAAASNFVITPNSANAGAAILSSSAIKMKTPPLASLTDVTNNSLSPVSYSEFLTGGAVAYIPAGIKDLELASFGQDPSLTLNFNELRELERFSFVLNGKSYEALISNDLREKLRDKADLAEYLNKGFLTLTTEDANSVSLRDLGVFASGFEGGLKLTGNSAFTSGQIHVEIEEEIIKTNAVVEAAETASGFRVFTREGRQVAGIPMSLNEAHLFLTETNGFASEAEYRADYLNPTNGVGYRGAIINNMLPGGYSTIESAASILTGGSLGSLIQQDTIFNPISAQTLTFETTTMSASGLGTGTADGVVNVDIAVNSGVNMKTIADDINIKLEPFGFTAEAKTYASLQLDDNASSSGDISFELSSGNSSPVSISGIFEASNLSSLVAKINQRSEQTGITAQVPADGSRIVLVQSDGLDISITNPGGQLLTVNSLDQNFSELSSETVLNADTKIIGSLSLRSPRAFKLTSSLDAAVFANSQTFSKEDGGVRVDLTAGGAVSDISIEVDPNILIPQVSPDGLRLAASNASFTLSARLNGSETVTKSVNTNELIDLSLASISETLVSDLRSTTGLPSLTGVALSTLPREGSQVSVLVGASQYEVQYVAGELVVSGPESGRVLAELQKNGEGTELEPYFYQLGIYVPGGVLNGTGLQLLDGGDLTEFGLASGQSSGSTQSLAKMQGRSFDALSLLPTDAEEKIFTVSNGEDDYVVTVTRDDSLITEDNDVPFSISVSPSGSAVTPEITKVGDKFTINLSMNYYDGSTPQEPLRISPSTNAAAFGFGAADFSVELTETGLKTVSMSGNPSGVTLEVENLPGQVLSMSGLPNEDFIVLLESEGAKRLASNFEMSTEEDTKAQKDYRVKVVDAEAGRVELIDIETGTSMATRFSNGVVEFEADNYRFELAGFGSTDDHFDIALNRSNAGDARNMIAMIALSRSTAERSSFQDDFRQIALAVGSQLESGRLLNISASAIRDAAIATEDELAGVNLDEEAGKLMEQQQAYKAAAQILQTARDLFDTIISIM
jgi:flagellar hook-associated protein 1 FlgK